MQTFEGNVGKKTFGDFLWENGKPQRGHKAMAPLHIPRAFFRSSWLWRCEVVDLCMYAAVLDV